MSSPVQLFRRLTNGVYVITAAHADDAGGFTAAWVTQVAFEPLLVAISINPGNATWRLIQASGRLVINVLKADQLPVARQFGTVSGRDADKLSMVQTRTTTSGGVIVRDAIAWFDCRLEQQVQAGDHVVVIARVVDGEILDPEAAPLRYSDTGDMDGSASLYPPAFE